MIYVRILPVHMYVYYPFRSMLYIDARLPSLSASIWILHFFLSLFFEEQKIVLFCNSSFDILKSWIMISLQSALSPHFELFLRIFHWLITLWKKFISVMWIPSLIEHPPNGFETKNIRRLNMVEKFQVIWHYCLFFL